MKSLPLILAVSIFGLLPHTASAASSDAPDRARQLLANQGSIPVRAAGPYVQVGTYRIQVSVKLGQPSARLPDGSWLYENFGAEDSAARGSLIVSFAGGRVSSLTLASPALVASLRSAPWSKPSTAVVAQQETR